jgi:hypothetical protein
MISEQQRQLIEKKYGKLIHKIGHNISGDIAVSSHEDNVQDLWMAALDAVRGFAKKEKLNFEDFWGTVAFDKYIKTCLWHLKNSKGARITKRYPLTKNTVDIVDNNEVLNLEDPLGFLGESNARMEEIPSLLTEEQNEILNVLVTDPTYIKPSGKVNVLALAKHLGKSWYEVRGVLDEMAQQLENEL